MWSHRRPGLPRPRRSSERGETLVEVLMAVMLLGTVVAAILGGLFALVAVADNNQEKTKISLAVQTYAEQLKQPVGDLAYIPCASGGSAATTMTAYQTKLTASGVAAKLPPGYTATIKVQFWTGGQGYGTTCPTGGDRGLQRFEVLIKNGRAVSDQTSETLLITKRNAVCPTTFINPDAGPC